jgi:hypothetical protein
LVPVLRRTAKEALHRARDTMAMSNPRRIVRDKPLAGTFFGECCFPGIYFVSNIFFSQGRRMPDAGLAETSWLTRAVNNAWAKPAANRRFAGFCADLTARLGPDAKSGEIDVG